MEADISSTGEFTNPMRYVWFRTGADFVNFVTKKIPTNENRKKMCPHDLKNGFAKRLFCCEGLVGLQRGPRHIPTACPLHDKSVPVASQ